MSIEKILQTPEGALKVKEKLLKMPPEDKKKPSYAKVLKMTNKALIGFGLKKKPKNGINRFSPARKLECLHELNAKMNNRFCLNNPKPLYTKAMQDILKKDYISKTKCRAAVSYFSRRKKYLLSIIVNKKRYDLDGNYHSDATENEIKHSKKVLLEKYGREEYDKMKHKYSF